MNPLQLQDIVGEVRKTLGEPEPNGYGSQQAGQGTWDNTQIIGYVNEAIGLVSHIARVEAPTVTVTLSTTTNSYALPADCLEDGLRKVAYNATGAMGPVPIRPLNLDEYEKLLVNPPYTIGGIMFSYYYTVWGGNILLAPYPQQATDTLTLYYYKTLATLAAATDVPAIPARFHVALVYFALARCQQAVEESNLYQEAWTQWQQMYVQMRNELSRKSRDRNRVRAR